MTSQDRYSGLIAGCLSEGMGTVRCGTDLTISSSGLRSPILSMVPLPVQRENIPLLVGSFGSSLPLGKGFPEKGGMGGITFIMLVLKEDLRCGDMTLPRERMF